LFLHWPCSIVQGVRLGNYLHIYDWARTSHPEWLKKNAKGFIPDLSDAGNLIWIETRTKRL